MYTNVITFSIVTTVSFNQSRYTFNEGDRSRYVYIGLVLSNVSSVDVTVQVTNKDITASELFILYTNLHYLHVAKYF